MGRKRKSSCSSSKDVYPLRFFKVYLPNRSSQQLELPSAFVKQVNGYLPRQSILECPGNRTWSIDVKKVGSSLCFQSGWSDFVQDNSLEAGDFLIFKYDGASSFSVQIYGWSTCEKTYQYGVKQCKIEAQDDEALPVIQYQQVDQNSDEMYKLVEREQHAEYEETNQLGEEVYELANEEDQIGDKMYTSVEAGQHDEYEETNEENEDEGESNELTDEDYQDREEMNELTEEYQDEEEMIELTDEEHSASENFVVSHKSQPKSSRKEKGPRIKTKYRGVQDKNKYKLLNATPMKSRAPYVPYKPVHPYFKLGVLPVYITHGSLNVPVPFAQKYLTSMKTGKGIKIDLQVSAKSWSVLLTAYKSGCTKISSGWLAFVRDNNIEEGDICVFELVDRDKFTFKVSIFRC